MALEVADDDVLAACLAQMRHVRAQIDQLDAYTRRWVAGDDGFAGLLRPLVPVLAEVGEAAGDLAAGFGARYDLVIDALASSAEDFRRTDEWVSRACQRVEERVAEVTERVMG